MAAWARPIFIELARFWHVLAAHCIEPSRPGEGAMFADDDII
jgi:hypothetical protein